MIAKGKSITHGSAALDYDLDKQLEGILAAKEVCRNEVYGETGEEITDEMSFYHSDFPSVKNTYLRFEVSPSVEESATMSDEDWKELAENFLGKMGLQDHQYIVVMHTGTERKKDQAHLHILVNRVSMNRQLYKDSWIGKKAANAANAIAAEKGFVQAADVGKLNKKVVKGAIDESLVSMKTWNFDSFKKEMGKRGCSIVEARSASGKLNGYYVISKSGTKYKASEIGKNYTLSRIKTTQATLLNQSKHKSHGFKLRAGKGGFEKE